MKIYPSRSKLWYFFLILLLTLITALSTIIFLFKFNAIFWQIFLVIIFLVIFVTFILWIWKYLLKREPIIILNDTGYYDNSGIIVFEKGFVLWKDINKIYLKTFYNGRIKHDYIIVELNKISEIFNSRKEEKHISVQLLSKKDKKIVLDKMLEYTG